MAFYWRLKDIPELQATPPAIQRRLWSEAVTRSLAPRYLLLLFANFLLGILTCALAVYLLGFGEHAWWWALLGLPLAGILNDYLVTQPRARGWLREHAGELDRYVTT
ncbi:MAG: hypothetical protein ABI178_01025 [Rhodanobacter sp.]